MSNAVHNMTLDGTGDMVERLYLHSDKAALVIDIDKCDKERVVRGLKKAIAKRKKHLNRCKGIRGYRHTWCLKVPTGRKRLQDKSASAITISVDPMFNGTGFIRINFNPSKLGQHGQKRLRKLLIEGLSEKYFNRIWKCSWVSYLEVAADMHGVPMEAVCIYKKRSRGTEIFKRGKNSRMCEDYAKLNSAGQILTMRLNSRASRLHTRIYNKREEVDVRRKKKGQTVSTNKEPWTRVEIVLKQTRKSPTELYKLKVNLCDLWVFDLTLLDEVMLRKPLSIVKPFFMAYCQLYGVQNAIRRLPRMLKQEMCSRLEKNLISRVSLQERFDEEWKGIIDEALGFLKPEITAKRS